jgi:hypothetical protein
MGEVRFIKQVVHLTVRLNSDSNWNNDWHEVAKRCLFTTFPKNGGV